MFTFYDLAKQFDNPNVIAYQTTLLFRQVYVRQERKRSPDYSTFCNICELVVFVMKIKEYVTH